MERFSNTSVDVINQQINKSTPANTKKKHDSIWTQFQLFCQQKDYILNGEITIETLAKIMTDYAFNMKKQDCTEYKEGVVKTMWNITAKNLQKIYYNDYNVGFDLFKDIQFEKARNARDAKRKFLQRDPSKRKQSATAFTQREHLSIINLFDENTPDGLQRKFYQIVAVELAWRGGEAANCVIEYFLEELDNKGASTGLNILNLK